MDTKASNSKSTKLLIGFLLYRNNRQKQKANVLLTKEKQKVENTLQELKSTQTQLIQSEKMASLGLQYSVNNFSVCKKDKWKS